MTLKNFSSALFASVFALFLVSCASKEAYTGKEGTDDSSIGSTDSPSASTIEPEAIDDDRKDPNSLLSERLVYFEFDKSAVLSEHLPILTAHADFLVLNRDKAIILQGHADERGSNEYNLALGQRRSDSVRDVLLSMGVFDSQIEGVSFGEEDPLVGGHSESAWRQNRRVEVVYTDE